MARAAPPRHLPLGPPGPDGAGWPDEQAAGRPGFDAATLLESGTRHAFEPEAHGVADLLVEPALARLVTGAADGDEPHLRQVFATACRMGAGLGRVERGLGTPDPTVVDRRVAAALWEARRRLPTMPPEWERVAAWFLLAGHRVARADAGQRPGVVGEVLRTGPGPA